MILEHCTVEYDGVKALDDVSLEIRPGERVAVIGSNGAGKSTLLRALADPTCAVVPQDVPADLPMGCRDYVMLGRTRFLSPWRRPAPADEAAVDEALRRVGVEALAGRRMDALSGGERQLMALAMALASGAETLILDEPEAHLDLARRAAFFRLLADLGVTAVVSLHDIALESARAAFTRCVLLRGGRIAADGAPGEVMVPERLFFSA